MNKQELIMQRSPNSYMSEAYRILRTNLFFKASIRELKTILITSATHWEGKSTVAGNLALAIAQTGKKVVILDGDLRKPSGQKIFTVLDGKGLSQLLTEKDIHYAETLQVMAENLYFLPSGNSVVNPAEILANSQMKSILGDLRAAFDYVIIDSPALLEVTDAQILASLADGVVLVASQGESSVEAVQTAKELLLNVKANLIGTVFNKSKIA
jgi:capsular exopolysaccharide synthesis family protein